MNIDYNLEVQDALALGKPVVALESTIISHGMPFPQNVDTARQLEHAVRENGATPATIALIEGRIKVGLNEQQLGLLGKEGKRFLKTSRRDLPFIISQRKNGATTVAATMIIAQLAGIKVFATGGIGGVHRGAEITMDISADLQELARTSVLVVSAGAKAILDLPLTLEYLETMGVPVIGYQTDEFPAFYTRSSGLNVDFRLDSPKAVANFAQIKWDMGLAGGILVANPIPETAELKHRYLQGAIDQALAEATEKGVKGKDISPFLLGRIVQLTSGSSLEANIELALSNARLAASIAAVMPPE